jgi:WD40 repeat protein
VWKNDLSGIYKIATGPMEHYIFSIAALDDGRLVTGGVFGGIYVWKEDLSGIEKTLQAPMMGVAGWTNAFAVLPGGRIMSGTTAGYGGTGYFQVWNVASGTSATLMTFQDNNGDSLQNVAVVHMPDGYIVAGTNDGKIHVWEDEAPYAKLKTLDAHTAEVSSLAAMSDGRLVSGAWDGTIKIWKKDTFELEKSLTGGTQIDSIAIMPDKRIISGSWDDVTNAGTIQVWKADLTGLEANFNSTKLHNLQAWGNKWIADNSGVISVFEID